MDEGAEDQRLKSPAATRGSTELLPESSDLSPKPRLWHSYTLYFIIFYILSLEKTPIKYEKLEGHINANISNSF